MPIWGRLYPVAAGIEPPADLEALARWMDRWGLLASQTLPAAARRQLEAVASIPVETVNAGRTPASVSREVIRLPAEWEPSEAVVIAWPVVFPGLWGFFRDLVAALAPVVRVDVLLPHEIYARAVLVYLGERWHGHPHVRFLVTATNDIWVRDYGPLTCLDSAGERVVVDPVFDPGLAMPTDDDDAFPARYAAHEGFSCRHLPLRLEGGNLSSDGQGTIIATDRLFAWNRHLPRDAVHERLREGLGAEALIVVAPLRMEDTGHVDVFVKLATPDTVLVTQPGSIVNGRRLMEAAKVFRISRNALGSSYRVVVLPSAPAYLNWGIVPVRPNYANALTVNGRVLVPIYRDRERDAAALAVYRQVMPDHDIIGIDARIAANAGGTVHCLTMQIPAIASAADGSRST